MCAFVSGNVVTILGADEAFKVLLFSLPSSRVSLFSCLFLVSVNHSQRCPTGTCRSGAGERASEWPLTAWSRKKKKKVLASCMLLPSDDRCCSRAFSVCDDRC